MLTKTIRGVIRDGKIEPSEQLSAPDGTEVTVQVPVLQPPEQGKIITFGMFADHERQVSAEKDLREAKHLWEREWERSWDRLNSDE